MTSTRTRTVIPGALALLLALSPLLHAQDLTGSIAGVVTDAEGQPLPGVRVTLEGTRVEAASALDGRYRLAPAPSGEATVEASYLGFDNASATVTVAAGATASLDLSLRPAERFFGSVTVIGEPLLKGQAKALNQQKNAVNIVNMVAEEQMARFPDGNSAEVTQRVPGLSLYRDQGEGRYVLIRGTEPRLNSMMVEGERLPSPEGDLRQVALDVIPSELLQSIEVTKALTADMDGDAIGGAVNLVMKRAPSEPRLYGAVGYGYNDLGGGSANQAAFAYGRRFADQRAGLMLAGSWFDTDRKSENFEVAYDGGELDELEYRDYEVNRERLGLALNLDFAPSNDTDLRFSSTWNQFDDQEYRRRVRNQVGDDRIERELKDRFESQTIWNVTGSAEHLFANASRLAVRLVYASADEDEPKGYYTTFRQDDVAFDPNVGPDSVDPDNIQANPLNEDYTQFALDEISDEDNLTTEEALVAALDYDLPFSTGGDLAGLWRFGLKYRGSTKDRDNETFVYETGEDVYLLDLLDTGYDVTSILDGRYPMGPFQAPGAARDLLGRPDLEGEKDHEEDTADFQADETVLAAYAAVELYLSDRLLLLPGLRYEQTDTDYTGYEVVFDSEGDWASTEPVKGSNDYGLLLPNLHLRYAIDAETNLRAAVTRTFARPNYADLAPYRLVLDEDAEIELGNPTLDPTSSWNLDLMVERYFATVGVVSAGAFSKSLQDFIYPFRFEEEIGDSTYEVTQPRNGDSASLLGLELAYHNQLRRLPAPWSGLGLFANYTWVDSEASFPGRGDTTVPGQSEHVGNLGLSYELSGFSGLVAVNFQGEFLEEVGGDAAEDVYVDDHVQLDLAAAYRFRNGLQVRLQLNNLTDEPFRRYLAVADRPVQEEYYSWGALLSLSYDFF